MNNQASDELAESERSRFKHWLVPMLCSLLLSLGLIVIGLLFTYRLFANEVTDTIILRDFEIFAIAAAITVVAGFANLKLSLLWRTSAVTALIWQAIVVTVVALVFVFVQYRANLPIDNSHIPVHIRNTQGK